MSAVEFFSAFSLVCESSFKKPFPGRKQQPSLATASPDGHIVYFDAVFSSEWVI